MTAGVAAWWRAHCQRHTCDLHQSHLYSALTSLSRFRRMLSTYAQTTRRETFPRSVSLLARWDKNHG